LTANAARGVAKADSVLFSSTNRAKATSALAITSSTASWRACGGKLRNEQCAKRRIAGAVEPTARSRCARRNARYGNRRFAGCVLVSDTESWVYRDRPWANGPHGATGVMTEWQQFVKNQFRLGSHAIPSPKLICIDLQPHGTTQAPERDDILNISGFSDAVLSVVAALLSDDAARFVAEVESIEL
jgi:hypothetical protein